jgi:hypothetical protein
MVREPALLRAGHEWRSMDGSGNDGHALYSRSADGSGIDGSGIYCASTGGRSAVGQPDAQYAILLRAGQGRTDGCALDTDTPSGPRAADETGAGDQKWGVRRRRRR